MIEIILEELNEDYHDGHAEVYLQGIDKMILIYLPGLGDEGIRVYHDGRLCERHAEKLHLKPIFIDKILINITGWFYLHYKLDIKVKEEYTEIKILSKV